MAGEPRPLHRVLAFLDHLLRCPPVVAEANNAIRNPAKISHDEPDLRGELTPMPFHLRDHPAISTPCRSLGIETRGTGRWEPLEDVPLALS